MSTTIPTIAIGWETNLFLGSPIVRATARTSASMKTLTKSRAWPAGKKVRHEKRKALHGPPRRDEGDHRRGKRDTGDRGAGRGVGAVVDKPGEPAMHMGMTAMSPKAPAAFSFGAPFLEVLGDVIVAWMHLWRGALAAPGLKKKAGSMDPAERQKKAGKNRDAAFYEGVVRTAEYFIQTILPITLGKMASIQKSNDAVMEIPEASFGGK